ncbi:MAG: sugar phosphate nucleotidyltransferase, partial [Gaiellaceae bacterium]
MRGLVLAAGPGRRLHPLTAALPKTLLPLTDGRTILDLALSNLRSVGLEDVVLVTGFAAERVEERAPELERRYGVRLELVFNDRAEEWNNAYSLWLARDALREGALLVNGDT